ncbi:MAG: hypothetical protein JJP05_07665 [cyanobacterium endosymbiont of Rhopalodia gibba]
MFLINFIFLKKYLEFLKKITSYFFISLDLDENNNFVVNGIDSVYLLGSSVNSGNEDDIDGISIGASYAESNGNDIIVIIVQKRVM